MEKIDEYEEIMENGIKLVNYDGIFEIVNEDGPIKSNGNVKIVKCDSNNQYNLQPTIRNGEMIPTEILSIGYEKFTKNSSNKINNYFEQIEIMADDNEQYMALVEKIELCSSDEEYKSLLEEYGLDIKWEIDDETNGYMLKTHIQHSFANNMMIYNTDFKPETNRKLLDAYAKEGCYDIEKFILYHIRDLQQCLGGIEGVKEFAEEWFEYNYDSRYAGIEEFFADIEKTSKDAELSEKIEESKELDEKIGEAEELLAEYEKQDPEQEGKKAPGEE